jgi:ATP-dependent Zn protease
MAGDDADVIFVLTTNRIELLEPALAMRPSRIDQAVEIKLPDAECRRRLLELYLRDVPGEVPDSALERIVAATSGVSAAFMRELVRRAVLLAADEATDEAASGGDFAVGDRHLLTALAALDAASAPLRRVLGAGTGA